MYSFAARGSTKRHKGIEIKFLHVRDLVRYH